MHLYVFHYWEELRRDYSQLCKRELFSLVIGYLQVLSLRAGEFDLR